MILKRRRSSRRRKDPRASPPTPRRRLVKSMPQIRCLNAPNFPKAGRPANEPAAGGFAPELVGVGSRAGQRGKGPRIRGPALAPGQRPALILLSPRAAIAAAPRPPLPPAGPRGGGAHARSRESAARPRKAAPAPPAAEINTQPGQPVCTLPFSRGAALVAALQPARPPPSRRRRGAGQRRTRRGATLPRGSFSGRRRDAPRGAPRPNPTGSTATLVSARFGRFWAVIARVGSG